MTSRQGFKASYFTGLLKPGGLSRSEKQIIQYFGVVFLPQA